MLDGDSKPYHVEPSDDGYLVLREDGYEVVRCRDEVSAQRYAVLLNKAYKHGFKSGVKYVRRS